MQGLQIHTFTQKDMITASMKTFEFWMMSLKNIKFVMFPTFKIICLADEIEEVIINNHLTNL